MNDSCQLSCFIHEVFGEVITNPEALRIYIFCVCFICLLVLCLFLLVYLVTWREVEMRAEKYKAPCQCTGVGSLSTALERKVVWRSSRVRRKTSNFLARAVPGEDWGTRLYHSPGDLLWTQRTLWAVPHSDALIRLPKVTWEEGLHLIPLQTVHTDFISASEAVLSPANCLFRTWTFICQVKVTINYNKVSLRWR